MNAFMCILLCVFALKISCYGQITLIEDDFLDLLGKTQILEEDSCGFISVSPGPAGANRTWDLTSVTLDAYDVTSSFVLPHFRVFRKYLLEFIFPVKL